MLRCNSSFINEWDNRWGYHPDSSNYHWAPNPNPAASLETTVQAMTLEDNLDPRCWDPQTRDPEVTETETDDAKPVVTKKEEVSASLSEKNSKRETLEN